MKAGERAIARHPLPLNACCKKDLERFYQLLLLQYEGTESIIIQEALKYTRRIDARLIEEFLQLARLEVRVLDTKKIPEAGLFHFTCPTCGMRLALVLMNAGFLLALWRVQMTLLCLITDYISEGPSRTRIRWRAPDDDDLRQIDIACQSYFGSESISAVGIKELQAKIAKAPPVMRERLEDAVTAAQLWIVAHEAAHFVQDHEPFWTAVDFSRRARLLARSYLEVEPPPPAYAEEWEVELAADAQATELVSYALTEAVYDQSSDADLSRRSAASRTAAGACAALWAINFTHMCKKVNAGTVETHPGTGARWKIVVHCLSTSANVPAEQIFDISQIQIHEAKVLFDYWRPGLLLDESAAVAFEDGVPKA